MNIKIFNSLPTDNSTQTQYATIARLDGKLTWEFMLLPTELQFSNTASYQPTQSPGLKPILQYQSTPGQSLSFSVPLTTVGDRLITEYVSQITSLLLPDPDVPPALYWQWGQRKLSPCIMTRCDRTEDHWTKDGQLKACKLAIALQEINENQLFN